MRRALFLFISLCAGVAQAAPVPFTASYTADWKQMPISGSAERSLEQIGENQWKLNFEASMLLAGLTEESTFSVQDGQLQPITYRYERDGLGKSKTVMQHFDWATHRVTGTDRDKPIDLAISNGTLDKSTYQQALQEDLAAGKTSMSYQVVDGDEIETYDFRVIGEEAVQTRAGLIDAMIVERVRDPTQSSRKTMLWFAKDWNFLLVRLHQVEKDGKVYQIMLKQAKVNGQEVVGRSR